jgi:hypothetical protein
MKVRISDGKDSILDYEAPDDPRLAEFDKHKKKLLDMLRQAYERGPKSTPFDADKAWRSLSGLARFYFGLASVKQKTMAAWERRERLREIAGKLNPASRLVGRTVKTDAGDDLYSAWCEANAYFRHDPEELEAPRTPERFKVFDPVRTKNEFDKVVAGLAALEVAATRAADHVGATKQGTPAILRRDELWQLAVLYRNSTGSIPGAGEGPFAEFVVEVLIAQGRHNYDEETGRKATSKISHWGVVDAIKTTRQWGLTDPVARKWGPSPFDKKQ